MSDISELKQHMNTKTLHFALLTLVTAGVWPLLWLYRKQSILAEMTRVPFASEVMIIWMALCFGLSRLLNGMTTPQLYGYDTVNDTLLILSFLLSLACGVLYIVWACKARTALRHYALVTFHFDLKMNLFYTVVFNVFYINYCINAMPDDFAKHQIIYGGRPSASEATAPVVTSSTDSLQHKP